MSVPVTYIFISIYNISTYMNIQVYTNFKYIDVLIYYVYINIIINVLMYVLIF